VLLSDNGRSREGRVLRTIDHDPRGRIVVLDSITRCEGNAGARDVVVAGSFAGAMSLGFGLEIGVRGLIAHDAGVGHDGAGFQHGGLDMAPKQRAFDAAHDAMLAAPRGAPSPEPIVDRRQRVVLETAAGRVVLVDSMLFARPDTATT
jgi:hypothetical protein